MFTRFGFFWPPTPLHLHFLRYKSLQKVNFLTIYPPSLVNVVCEHPLRDYIVFSSWKFHNPKNTIIAPWIFDELKSLHYKRTWFMQWHNTQSTPKYKYAPMYFASILGDLKSLHYPGAWFYTMTYVRLVQVVWHFPPWDVMNHDDESTYIIFWWFKFMIWGL